MKVVVTAEAAQRLQAQIRYIRDQHAPAAAERLAARVNGFLRQHLARFPRLGRRLEERDLWEAWIPKTKIVVWYRIQEDRIAIISVWHAAQNRLAKNEDDQHS